MSVSDISKVKTLNTDDLPNTNKSFEPLTMLVQKHVAAVRERNRTTSVNGAFSLLRACIPTEPKDRKLSKVETLRLATSYISHLATVITARTVGDYDGQVCQRYGYFFRERVESSGQKHICTFCLADSKRNCHRMIYKSEDSSGSEEPPVEIISSTNRHLCLSSDSLQLSAHYSMQQRAGKFICSNFGSWNNKI